MQKMITISVVFRVNLHHPVPPWISFSAQDAAFLVTDQCESTVVNSKHWPKPGKLTH